MPNHFTDLGFDADSSERAWELSLRAAREGTRYATKSGEYRVWSIGEGIALWAGLDRNGQVLGCDPSFTGHGRMNFRLEGPFSQPPVHAPTEGALKGLANATPSAPDGLCPVLIDLPGFELHLPRLRPNQFLNLQVTAFADTFTGGMKFYRDEATFTTSFRPGKPKYSPEFFVPSGLYTEPGRPPSARGLFAGRIQWHVVRTNPATRRPFHHLLVNTGAGTLDIVSDPAWVPEKPVVGGIVTGSFWLCGQIVS